MKTKFFLIVSTLLLTGIYGCWTMPQSDYSGNQSSIQNNNSQTYSSEYNQDDLNAYGEWIVLPEYGRVWRPSTNSQWQPFSDGHWVYDGNEWVWDSYEPYGAIVYHYGNWEYAPGGQWIWIPNHAGWSPACVDWVYYGNEVAWAPRPRPGHSFGNPWDNQGHHAWIVVHNENFYDDHVYTHKVGDATRDNGKYRDDQINRRPPPVSYVRDHTQRPISVIKDINRNGTIRPNRPVGNTTPPVGTSQTNGGHSATQTPTTQVPAAQTPTTHPPTSQVPATQPPANQPPIRTSNDSVRTHPTQNNPGTVTPPGVRPPVTGGRNININPLPVKPQPVNPPIKVTRPSRNNAKRGTTPTVRQAQPVQNAPTIKKENQVKKRQQPVEQKAAPARDKQDKKDESK